MAGLGWGQAVYSFSPQGAAALANSAGRRVPGFQLVGAVVCEPAGSPEPGVAGGAIYQAAARAGISWVGPNETALARYGSTAGISVR